MKKLLVFFLALFLVISIVGCKKDGTSVIQPTTGDETNGASDGGTQTPVDEGIKPSPTSPIDISLENAYWSTINPDLNQQLELKLKIKNTGTDPVEAFDYNVRITKDGTTWKDETKEYSKTLYPGNTTKIELPYTFTSEGAYKAEVYLDKDHKLKEKNWLNNVKITSLAANARKASSTAGPSSDSSDDEDTGDSGSSSSGNCVDTDEGKDSSVRGECNDGVTTFGIDDYCNDDATAVFEWYCGTDDRCHTENMACADGCESGECI